MPLKVMVIDSNVMQLQSIRDELSTNYVVLSCSRGTRALDLFKVYQPQALIISILTEDLNIEGFIEGIQKIPSGFCVPIWFTNCGAKSIGNPYYLSLHPTLFLEESLRPSVIRAKLDLHFNRQKV